MSRRARLPRRAGCEHGFTLIELVIGVAIFAVVSAGVAVAMGSALTLDRNDRNRSIAANLASQEMDGVRTASFASLPLGTTTTSQTIDGVSYQIVRDTGWVQQGNAGGPCDAPPPPVGTSPHFLLGVKVQVTWPNMGGTAPVSSDSALSPPVAGYSDDTGHIAVKVRDVDGELLSGVPVTIIGPAGSQTLTSDNGCAFFGYLGPGSYTASLSKPGYVDRQGATSPSQSLSVLAGAVSSVQFDYDQASAVTVTLAGLAGYPVRSGTGVTLANAGLTLGYKLVATTGSSVTVPSLFPFPDGYDVWGGTCLDSDPEGTDPSNRNAPFYPTGQRQAPVLVTPGATSLTTVNLKSVTVHVKRAAGQSVANVAVQAVHVNAASDRCTSSTISVGTTNTSGDVKAALPYGKWTLQVTGRTPSPSWPVAVFDPTTANPMTVQVVVT